MLHTSRRHVHTHANYRKHTHTRIRHTHVCVCVWLSSWQLESSRTRRTRTSSWLMHWRNQLWLGATVTATVSPSSCLSLPLSLFVCLSLCVCLGLCVWFALCMRVYVCLHLRLHLNLFSVLNAAQKLCQMKFMRCARKTAVKTRVCMCVCVWVRTCVCAPLKRDNWLYLPTVAAQVFESSLALALPLRVAYFMAFPSLIRRQQQYFISNCWQSFLIKYDRLPDLVCGPPNWISRDAAARETESWPSWRCHSCKASVKVVDAIVLKALL